MFLTKKDFVVSQSCATKLYYKKLGYPSVMDDDPYLDFMPDGGPVARGDYASTRCGVGSRKLSQIPTTFRRAK